MPPTPPIEDRKYIVFKRDEFFTMVGSWFGKKAPNVDLAIIAAQCDRERINDAVVIRRQDYFASPALATYASMIAIAINVMPESSERRDELLKVADYFQQQAELAAEEGWKTPDV